MRKSYILGALKSDYGMLDCKGKYLLAEVPKPTFNQ